jgi:hypothetical protein
VDAEVFQANGTAERDAALVMMERLGGTEPLTVGGGRRALLRPFARWIFALGGNFSAA